MLCGAEEACWAHNPKVGGSKPPTATFSHFFVSCEMVSCSDVPIEKNNMYCITVICIVYSILRWGL